MTDLQREYEDLLEEIRVGSVATSELPVTEFFNMYSSIAAENGDTPDLEYCPVLKESNNGYRIDGYAFDFMEVDGAESGDLYVAVCDYRHDKLLPAINISDINKSLNGVIRFIKYAANKKFLIDLEQTSPAYQLAVVLHQYINRINRLRVILFTNGHLSSRKKVFEPRELGNFSLHVNVLDIERFSKIASQGREPVEIEFIDALGGPIECLPASVGETSYKSYLFAIPGLALADIFAVFGNRLLEQNVRTYLQAKTKVNKGILNTISKEPEMFFAYNNGVTATASEVSTCKLSNGTLAISKIKDFQVVNGGQTTASLLYARDSMKLSLDNVHVQVKLSVVEEKQLDVVVPKISEYANTQNKISLADLASNSPIQIKIERLSKEIQVPQKAGELYSRKWFYERTRGQYRSLFSYKTKSEKSKLELTYPKSHMITKTDLAKYELSFDCKPHHVSEGAQKCFSRYAEQLSKKDIKSITETWFRRNVAKCILFLSLDKAVQQSTWYADDRGYKAQIITYAIAACSDGYKNKGYQIDLDRIWKDQSVPSNLLNWMLNEAKNISTILKSPPSNVRNISEFAKREFCWLNHVKGNAGSPTKEILEYGIPVEDLSEKSKEGFEKEKANKEIDFDVTMLKLTDKAADLKMEAEKSGLASPKNISALKKISEGNSVSLTKSEKNSLKNLLARLNFD